MIKTHNLMYKKNLIIALVLCTYTLKSQNNYWVKFYPISLGIRETWELNYDPKNLAVPAKYRRENERIVMPFLGFAIERPNGRFWEIGVAGSPKGSRQITEYLFSSQSNAKIGIEQGSELKIQVETYKLFRMGEKQKTRLSWGWMLNISSQNHLFKPHPDRTDWYVDEVKTRFASIGIVPRMQVQIFRRLNLDINVPCDVLAFGVNTFYNSKLTSGSDRFADFMLFGYYNFRLGLAWRLNRTQITTEQKM
jgi:hypothetical protein